MSSRGKENYWLPHDYGMGPHDDPMMIKKPGVFYFVALHGLPLASMTWSMMAILAIAAKFQTARGGNAHPASSL